MLKRLAYWLKRGKNCTGCCLICAYYNWCAWETGAKQKMKTSKKKGTLYQIAKFVEFRREKEREKEEREKL